MSKLVQIIKSIETPNPSPIDAAPGGKCFQIVADFPTVADALDAISDDQFGPGPFDVVSVNRRGVKLQDVTEKVLDPGTAFGSRTAKPKPPAPKPPSSSKTSGSTGASTAAKK